MTRLNAPLAGVLAMVGAFAIGAPAATAADAPVDAPAAVEALPAPDRVIVQWRPAADRADRVEARADADVALAATLGDRDFQLVEVDPERSVGDAIEALEDDPAVAVAERDGYSSPQALPNDPLLGQLWGLRNLGGPFGVLGFSGPLAGADVYAAGAWVRTVGTPTTLIADLDSGYRFNHPDLAPVAWTNSDEIAANGIDDDANGFVDDRRGYDFVGANSESPANDPDPTDDDLLSGGHGVHTAGTMAAKGNNGVGISGVAQDVRVMPLRVCSNAASLSPPAARCPISSQVAAINYAGTNGARVANMSLGGTSFNQTVVNAIAANPQTLFVISAGNDGVNNDSGAAMAHHYPCDYDATADASPAVPGAIDNIVCVAATNQADGLAGFSDFGATSVDVGAPGTEVLSAYPTSERWSETFETADFGSRWTATSGGGFARTNEAPLTSFGMADTPGGPPTPSTTRQATSTGVTIPAGLGSCIFSQRRNLSVGGGNSYTYAVLLNDVSVFQSAAVTTSGVVSTVPIPELDAGGTVKIRQTYAVGAAPLSTSGVWLDDFRLTCYESPSSSAATFSYSQGTSMAAPHVTGAAALLLSAEPSLTVTQLRDALLDTVDPVASLAGKTVTGGRIDISAVLDLFDDQAPAAPQLTATVPASGSNANAPAIRGVAEDESTVRIYAGGACAGAPVATGPAAQLAGAGFSVPVPDNSTTTFSARTTDTAGNASAGCSGAISYSEVTPPPVVINILPPGNDRTVEASGCRVPKLKGLSLSRARALLGVSNCKLGKVTKPKKKKGQKKLPPLIVKSSKPKAGAELAAGTKVAVTLGPKPKPKPRKKR